MNLPRVADPPEVWEYWSDERIQEAIEADRIEYEIWLERSGAVRLLGAK